MIHKYGRFVRFINILFDLFILNLISYFIITGERTLYNALGTIMWLNVTWFLSSYFAKLYDYKNLVYFRIGMLSSFKSIIIFTMINTSINYFLFSSYFLTKQLFLIFLIYFIFCFTISRIIFYLLKKYFELEFYWSNNVLLIGNSKISDLLINQFSDKKELGYKYSFHLSEFELDKLNNESLLHLINEKNIDEVFFVGSSLSQEKIYNCIKLLDHNSIRVKFVPDFTNFYTKPNNLFLIGDYPVLYLRSEPLQSLFNRMVKRFFDIIFSFFVILLIFSWLFPIISLLIKIESKGPIFFKQKRSGRDNTHFWCFKFRSMRINELSDVLSAKKNDSRITKIGQILRKTSIDELPQFFNVILGNMSIVGPRPHMISHTNEYANVVDRYMVRHFVKPGITGWAQVNGYRGEIQKLSDIEGRVEKDIWYIENWSFMLDIQIILLTVYNIFRGEEKAY